MRISYDGVVVRIEKLFVAEYYYTLLFEEESNSDNVEVYLFKRNGVFDIYAIRSLHKKRWKTNYRFPPFLFYFLPLL